MVGERFHIKPLLPMFVGDGRFFILAVSQNDVRVLNGTRNSVDKINLEDMPTSLAEALRFEDPERQLQIHTSTDAPRGVTERPSAFHGYGVGTNDAKINLLRYFHILDRGLNQFLSGENIFSSCCS